MSPKKRKSKRYRASLVFTPIRNPIPRRQRIEVATMLGSWFVRCDAIVKECGTKSAALKFAVEMAKGFKLATVRIHDKHGRFQSERTYPRSSDPFPPRG